MANLKKCVIGLVLPLSLLAGACVPYSSAFAQTTLTPISSTSGTASYSVSGVVVNSSGSQVSGAAVAVNGQTYTTTGSDGSYSLNLPDGTYTVTVSDSGYQTASFSLNVDNSNLSGENITLTANSSAATYTVSGVVTDNSGYQIGGAALAINGQNYTTTDADGSYSLNLPDGNYTLTVSASGYQTATFNVDVADSSLTGQNITLNAVSSAAAYTVSGVVADNNGNPVSGAILAINGQNYTTTGADGSYSLSLPDGTYTLTVSADNYQTATLTLNVADSNATSQNITLTTGASNINWNNQDNWNQMLNSGCLNGKPVTRAMFMAMLVNKLNLNKEANLTFVDVPSNAWYAKSLSLAVGAGLVHGVSANNFAPNQVISVKQMQAMIGNANRLYPQFNQKSYTRVNNGMMNRRW